MIGTGTLAVVLLVFFVAGIGAAVVVVIALSVRRTRKPPRPDWPLSDDEPDWPVSEDEPDWPLSEDEPDWPVSRGGDWPRRGE